MYNSKDDDNKELQKVINNLNIGYLKIVLKINKLKYVKQHEFSITKKIKSHEVNRKRM